MIEVKGRNGSHRCDEVSVFVEGYSKDLVEGTGAMWAKGEARVSFLTPQGRDGATRLIGPVSEVIKVLEAALFQLRRTRPTPPRPQWSEDDAKSAAEYGFRLAERDSGRRIYRIAGFKGFENDAQAAEYVWKLAWKGDGLHRRAVRAVVLP